MMLKNRGFARFVGSVAVAAFTLAANQAPAAAAGGEEASVDKQRKLIRLLQSDAPPQDKAITCKQLAIYGTEEAVPALALLLSDESLASWARIALEVIPGPAADESLRQAMDKLQGALLIGVINSIASRRDAKAIPGLLEKLENADADVASAAAVALGRLGGTQAAKALEQALASAPAAVRPAVAEGCILCAEKSLAEGKPAEAVKLYDAVRQANVPKQRQLEAVRGAILARRSAGIPLLIEQLRSADKALFGIGLRTARELSGREVTEALAAELDRANPDRQFFLLLAIADRRDGAVLPAVLKMASGGPKRARIAAVGLLERLGSISCMPVMLDAAADDDAELAKTAKAVLTRLPYKEVDADLLARLPQATGKRRQVIIELAGQRGIDKAVPAIVQSADDADAGIRSAAVQALGTIGKDNQAADLVRLLQKNPNPKERADLEKALLALSGRSGAACVQYLLPLAQNTDSALRAIGLHALASVGGTEALAAVKSALNDPDESVQDEAVRTLSTWPNNWPEDLGVAEPLLALVKSDQKLSHQVLGIRGYLQHVQGHKKLKDDEKAAKINELLPLIKRPEEKRLAIAVISDIPTAGALELLRAMAAEAAVADEACSAIVNIAGKEASGIPSEQRRQALQVAMDKSNNDATKKRAKEALNAIK